MMQISQELAELKQQRDETLNKVKHTLMHSRFVLVFLFSPQVTNTLRTTWLVKVCLSIYTPA